MNAEQPQELYSVPLPEGYEIGNWPAFCGESIAFEAQDRALTLPRWIFLYHLSDQSIRPLEIKELKPLRMRTPTCSPDGHYLAVSAYLDGRWELIVSELDTGAVVSRIHDPDYPVLGNATWPNDQQAVWWMGTRINGFYDINETRKFQDSDLMQTRTFAKGKYPAIAPDGSRLAFFCGNLLYLCVARVSSAEMLFQIPISYFKLIDDLPVAATASWASDGQWLYFASSITGNWDIYRVRADGSQVQNLTEDWLTDEFMPSAR